jgi:serine phosphatase RsbU (regulator of sigma subunit)
MRIRLREIDLSKGHKHTHPDIKINKVQYLVKVDGHYGAGPFFKDEFGLQFAGRPIQTLFEVPIDDNSRWEAVWEICEAKEKSAKKQRRQRVEIYSADSYSGDMEKIPLLATETAETATKSAWSPEVPCQGCDEENPARCSECFKSPFYKASCGTTQEGA